MKLFINDTEIEIITKENDTIQSMVTAVMGQLDTEMIIASMAVDGEYQSVEDPQVLSRLISTIGKIELTISGRKELGISLLENAIEFVRVASQELKNGSTARRREIISTLIWIEDCLDALKNSLAFPPADISIIRAIVTNVVKVLDEKENDISLQQLSGLGQELENILKPMELLIEKLQNEEKFTKDNVFSQLRSIQEQLPDLATYFQSGNDVLAIQTTGTVIDCIDMFLRFSASLPSDPQIEQHGLELKDLSTQLLGAFENKDFILIADLVEYDLNDIIENILENDEIY